MDNNTVLLQASDMVPHYVSHTCATIVGYQLLALPYMVLVFDTVKGDTVLNEFICP